MELDKHGSDADHLIMVDHSDREIGYCSREECHTGDGKLHRAFSVLFFNTAGELLLQRRSEEKLLWPGFWSNSCCSHPRRGEKTVDAAHRRMSEELGMRCRLIYLYKFQYHAEYGSVGTEHEICSVFWGHSGNGLDVARSEIMDWRFISPEALNREMHREPEQFTPWFKLEWEQVSKSYLHKYLEHPP